METKLLADEQGFILYIRSKNFLLWKNIFKVQASQVLVWFSGTAFA
jgi:hypothetical protein